MSATPIGSAWDVALGPDSTDPRHLAEWIEGSACHPELAAANVQSLSGSAVFEALAGERLEQLGAHGKQHVTAETARILRHLEGPSAGGWWVSGLNPLADWGPMGWGQFKPDKPRLNADGKPLKYEAPWGISSRSIWLAVPSAVSAVIADHFRLAVPSAVSADTDGRGGEFWRWWAAEPRLPLLVVEGAKKAGALLSAGVPAVALPGIWNGAPKNPETGRSQLLADLAAVPLERRRVSVLFDASSKAKPQEPNAARRLGLMLAKAGASVLVGICPGTHGKGADDHLVNGGTWEQLSAVLEPIRPEPVLPRLRPFEILAPASSYLGEVAPIPPAAEAQLVALAAPMGSGKTEAIAAAVSPLLAEGKRVVLISHRRSLGKALAERLGLPWGDDAKHGSDLRQQGMALCIDSLCSGSAMRFNPADWAGSTVLIDEAAQVLAHALFATGTAIGKRRPEVLENLSQLLAGAAQVIAADALLDGPHLKALEAATGCTALLIGSEHRPATGRELIAHPDASSWRGELATHLQARKRLWITCTAQEAGAKNSAQSLAQLVELHWPEARILLVDSETVADHDHDAHRLAEAPNAIAGRHDVVICSPAVAAGLSVDQLPGHFAAVFVFSGGTITPDSIAQAAARVRDDCPRHLYAPERSPGAALRVGSGSFEPAELLKHQARHGAAIAAQLVGTIDYAGGTFGPWLPLWAELAAISNRQGLAYGATVRGLLEREGYACREATAPIVSGQAIGEELKAIAEAGQAAEDAAVIAAPLLSDQEAAELRQCRRRLQPAEKTQLARWRISKAWGLGADTPTLEVLEADREQRSERGRFGWALCSIKARQLVARFDQAAADELALRRQAWAPDLCRELVGPRITAADALGLPDWLSRGDWFTAKDPRLLELQATTETHRSSCVQVLGCTPAKTATATLRRLLRLTGHRLEAHRCRIDGERAWRYRVVPEALPAGVTVEQLQPAWTDQLQADALGVSQKIPFSYGEH